MMPTSPSRLESKTGEKRGGVRYEGKSGHEGAARRGLGKVGGMLNSPPSCFSRGHVLRRKITKKMKNI
jgi:hypothetical protein